MSSKKVLILVALVALLAGALFSSGLVIGGCGDGDNPALPRPSAIASPQIPGLNNNSVADIVSQVGLAVVKIDTTVISSSYPQWDPLFNDPFFREFFGRSFVPSQPRERHGMGSGFIFSKDGYILTNEHVIQGASAINVTITGFDKPIPAQVIGSDHDLDLAILKVNVKKDLPYLKIGDSDRVRVGDLVIAIGNPYGLDHTVTMGVVSAKGRPITIEDRSYENLLQTDASINPGNSGGPLLNLQGEVIGINTAVNAQAQGIGFAIPTSTIRPVLDELLRTGQISHPWLGVQLETLTPEMAQYAGLQSPEGALILAVVPNSPAAKARLRPGDIILKINDRKISSPNDVVTTIRARKVGEKIKVVLQRDGESVTQELVLERKP
ncbi:S1C family serine protease [Desulforudis sp. 1088]|uniref:S1C family serine protease n=1 Tax=unclassified Candidatus Desulforudis TaxID=2635950 RepID=UPI003494118E